MLLKVKELQLIFEELITRTELHRFADSTKRRSFEQALKHPPRFSSENGIEILLSDLDTGEP
jgi:hypothetical protein